MNIIPPVGSPCRFQFGIRNFYCIPQSTLDVGVARTFKAIEVPNQEAGELWTARVDYCRWRLKGKTNVPRPPETLNSQKQVKTKGLDILERFGTLNKMLA